MDGPSFEFEWASDLYALWCPIDSGSDFYPRELRNRRRFYFTRFRLGIVGDARTGKSTFVRRHLTGEFEQGYEPTRDLRFENLDFHTNYGNIHFCCKDFNRPIWQRQGRSQFIDCAIIMFDVTDRRTYENVSTWHEDLRRNPWQIPIVLCGNKVDMENRQVTTAELVTFCREMNLQYYEISARSNYNIEKPFLYLARKLAGERNLHFVAPPALAPPEVQIDFAQQQLQEQELAAAAAQPLPDNDDEFFD